MYSSYQTKALTAEPNAISGTDRVKRTFLSVLLFFWVSAAASAPVPGHPRLWMDSSDVARLRTWAVPTNPIWQEGLRTLGVNAAAAMDAGDVPADDNGGSTYSSVNTEAYAALFAFLANVDPDAAARIQWAQRGRTLLMHVIEQVDTCLRATPPIATGPFCSDSFGVSDRMRWQGASFPLAYDWLMAATLANGQPVLSAADRAAVRRVFIWWCELNMEAYPNPYNNPPAMSMPVGTMGEPLLRQPQDARRFRIRSSVNNYYAGHMRQLGLMAIAIDPVDDVVDPLAPLSFLRRNGNGVLTSYPYADANGRLAAFLPHALDGWLYLQDHALRNEARGGMPPEGMEYAPTSIGIPAQFLYALETSGYAALDVQQAHGARVAGLSTNPFYRDLMPGFVHTLSPIAHPNANRGLVYWPAWYGDGEFYYQGDPISILGPIGLHAARIGDVRTADAVRWLQRHIPPRGSSALLSRARGTENLLESLIYFMLFDPAAPGSAPTAPDPRTQYGSAHWSDGMGRLLSRTGWDANARWLSYKLSWNMVDHQQGDGNQFELYRRGEWLTKSAMGYGLEGGASDYKNTVTVENTQWPSEDAESLLARMLRRGAQMPQNRQAADPIVSARSEHAAYTQVTGDATNLYNAHYVAGDQTPLNQRATDVEHVSRTLVWIKPDHVYVYDRVRTNSGFRAKRFWLNLPDRLPSLPAVDGRTVTGTTPNGQKLFVTSVLPEAAVLDIVTTDPEISIERDNLWSLGREDPILQRRQYVDHDSGLPVPGTFESFATRLRITASSGVADERFLTVLEGADGGFNPVAATLVESILDASCGPGAGAFDGVSHGGTVVLFRRSLDDLMQCLEYVVPDSVQVHLVSGLVPHGGYDVASTLQDGHTTVTIMAGDGLVADEGGVIRFDPDALPAPVPRLYLSQPAVHLAVVSVGDVAMSEVSVTNRGNAAAALGTRTLGGVSSPHLSVTDDCGASLAAGQSCSVMVRCEPSASGFREAAWLLTSDSTTPLAPLAVSCIADSLPPSQALLLRNGFE